MTMNVNTATLRIVRELADVEVTLDQLIAKQAQLLSLLLTAGTDVEAPIAEGQAVLLRLGNFQSQLIGARSQLCRTHDALRRIGEVRSDLFVDDKCPPATGLVADSSKDLAA